MSRWTWRIVWRTPLEDGTSTWGWCDASTREVLLPLLPPGVLIPIVWMHEHIHTKQIDNGWPAKDCLHPDCLMTAEKGVKTWTRILWRWIKTGSPLHPECAAKAA